MSRQDAEDLSSSLLAAYDASWNTVISRQRALFDSRNPDRDARQLADEVSDSMDDLDAQTRDWLTSSFAGAYGWGAFDADSSWDWDADSTRRATEAANDLYVRLYGATSGVVRTTARLARSSVLDSDMAASQFTQVLRSHGAAAVVYRGGARIGLGTYARMAIRTATSLAYNQGSVRAGLAAGARWFDCYDGPGCGLDSHDDGDIANGLVESAEFAFAHPLSHPNCQRVWTPAYEVTSRDEADARQDELQADNEAQTVAEHLSRGQQRLQSRLASREQSITSRHSGGNV